MTVHALEPQPLAFRVRPQTDECFDSWIDRVAAAHETTRPELFRHLGLESALASMDLARGTCGLANEQYFAVDQMIGQLAWAVQIEPQQVEDTFLNVEASAVLPRRQRRYVCPRCWQQAWQDGRAPIICKEWILRMSWRCRHHDFPLCRLPAVEGMMSERARRAWIDRALAKAENLRQGLAYRPRLIEWNAEGVDRLVPASRKRFKGEKQRLCGSFSGEPVSLRARSDHHAGARAQPFGQGNVGVRTVGLVGAAPASGAGGDDIATSDLFAAKLAHRQGAGANATL